MNFSSEITNKNYKNICYSQVHNSLLINDTNNIYVMQQFNNPVYI